MEPEKPFACSMPDCGMTFTNEDHLHVHTKKHDMVLQLGMGQKAAFVADQTPTPTRFIRNCEEVGLFQDLQNVAVNPFDEGFKRAMETKHCMLTLEGPSSSEDVLHTPHLVFPLESGDCTLYTTNNQHNITISRSSSDESGAVKEYETTKISKLTNEVTISRIVGKDDVSIVRHEENTKNKDILNETSVSYTNNVIIHSNVEIRQDINIDTKKVSHNNDSITKDLLNMNDLVKFNDTNKLKEAPPIMSQKSLDFVVDSLTTESNNREENLTKNFKRNIDNDKLQEKDGPKRNFDRITKASKEKKDTNATKLDNDCDFEVIVKLPNGKHFRMKAEDEVETPISAKEKLNSTIINKIQKPALKMEASNPTLHNVVPICTGTLIPVTLINPNMTMNQTLPMNHLMNPVLPVVQNMSHKIPIAPFSSTIKSFKSVKRKNYSDMEKTKAKDNKRKETEMNENETGECSVNKSKELEVHVNVRGGCNNVNKSKELEVNVNVSGGCSVNKSKELEINVNKKDGRLRTQRDNSQVIIDRNRQNLESRSAASRRYRERSKQTMQRQSEENKHLREMNRRLSNEKAVLQLIITEHLRDCPTGADLSCTIQEKLQDLNNF